MLTVYAIKSGSKVMTIRRTEESAKLAQLQLLCKTSIEPMEVEKYWMLNMNKGYLFREGDDNTLAVYLSYEDLKKYAGWLDMSVGYVYAMMTDEGEYVQSGCCQIDDQHLVYGRKDLYYVPDDKSIVSVHVGKKYSFKFFESKLQASNYVLRRLGNVQRSARNDKFTLEWEHYAARTGECFHQDCHGSRFMVHKREGESNKEFSERACRECLEFYDRLCEPFRIEAKEWMLAVNEQGEAVKAYCHTMEEETIGSTKLRTIACQEGMHLETVTAPIMYAVEADKEKSENLCSHRYERWYTKLDDAVAEFRRLMDEDYYKIMLVIDTTTIKDLEVGGVGPLDDYGKPSKYDIYVQPRSDDPREDRLLCFELRELPKLMKHDQMLRELVAINHKP